jgi:hypothetical protein
VKVLSAASHFANPKLKRPKRIGIFVELRPKLLGDLVPIQAVGEEKLDDQPLFGLDEKCPSKSFDVPGNVMASQRGTQRTEIESNVFSMVS